MAKSVPVRYQLRVKQPSTLVFSWVIEPPDEHAGIPSEVTVTIRPDADRQNDRVRRRESRTAAR